MTISPQLYFAACSFLFGLVFGSFMNVLIARLPRNQSIAFPPSHCPKCNHTIRFYHNIPLVSYIMLKGKCYDCGVRISIVYPLVELLTGLIFLAVFLKFGISYETLKFTVFAFLLLGAGLTDLFTAFDSDFECGIIPDTYTLGGTVIGLLFALTSVEDFKVAVAGAAVGFLSLWIPAFLYKLLRKREGMGGGDIKLMMMIGAFIGFVPIYFIFLGSAIIGMLVGIPLVIFKKDKEFMIPYGIFIMFAALFYLFFESFILRTMGSILY